MISDLLVKELRIDFRVTDGLESYLAEGSSKRKDLEINARLQRSDVELSNQPHLENPAIASRVSIGMIV